MKQPGFGETVRHGSDLTLEERAFVSEIVEVCRRHGMWLAHEDQHGAFEIWPSDASTEDWLTSAHSMIPPFVQF